MEGKIVILGAGESGLGTAFLARKKGLKVFISDNDSISIRIKKKLNLLGVSWEEKKHSYSKMKDADMVIKSPGVKNESKVISQLRKMNIPIWRLKKITARRSWSKDLSSQLVLRPAWASG